uniref:Upstream transcription factor 2, c-fos interacting n=1 Tax=Petromyzon marinus TaxID=7757 RepID=S4RZ92_PETMA
CDIFQSAMQPLATSIASHGTALEKSHDGDEGSLQMQEGTSAGDGSGADDHTAVAIASVQQATAFNDPSIQYQFRTESSDGQGGAQRPIAPRTHPYTPKLEGPRTPRDERRRAQHNEVERRRRDKINNWIVELSKYIPDCANDHTKSVQSKGGVLSKACEYIQELRQTNQRMEEELKEAERTQLEHELLMQQFEELKNESALLRTQLQQHGIEVVGSVPGQ